MPKTVKFLKVFFPLVLTSIALFLCFKNYTSGTYLIGWDSMHSEFNFPLNSGRMLSHVWGSEMGVGAISAHSDMGDLPRIVFLWISSLIIPVSFIRYFYVFVCLILGPLGMYFFLKYIFQIKKDSLFLYPAAFLGALFYLLNLGTLQNFYVPLEMFTVAFAGVPWIFLIGLKYLREGKKKNLLLFSMVVILISPMAYAATQAYAIYLGIFIFLLVFSLISSGKKLKLKRFLLLGIVALLLNIYWILPNIYSIVQQSGTISNANINRLFSQESFLRNADYGDFKDILVQKSFLFSWRNFDFSNGTFKDLLKVWNNHLSSSFVLPIGYTLGCISIIGLILVLIKKDKIGISLLLPLILCLFFLVNINPPTGVFYKYLYDHFEIFREGLRTPFTKFSVLFEFILSFYFGNFFYKILTYKTKSFMSIIVFIKILFIGGTLSVLTYFSFPMFRGELIGKNARVKLPSEYSQLFSWFKDHTGGRIALMPIPSKYGWEYRSWGYEGSGFLTYGIPNPILYRDFDRWSSFNEDFYSQSSFALYAGDDQGFVDTLKKYQVKYLLLDESIINAGGSQNILKIPEIKQIANKYKMKKVANFGFLSVYNTNFSDSEVFAPQSNSEINIDFSVNFDAQGEVKKVDLSINQGFDGGYNCDLAKLGKVSKQITETGILYKATGGGVECDFIGIPSMEYKKAYSLHIAGQNSEGRSLKIYLFDSISQVPYLEEILPMGDFEKTYYIYPRDIKGNGYVMNLETRSFGRIASENLISKVEFYPIDYTLLSTFKGASLQGVDSIENNLEIKSVKKYGTWGYRVEVANVGLLALGQGYERGWIAVRVGQSWSELVKSKTNSVADKLRLVSTNFNFLQHVKINSWANGWIIENSQSQSKLVEVGSNGEADHLQLVSTIYLFYWPQVLEWGGMLTGVITIIVILVKVRRS